MKFLFDLFPVILFFAAFKLGNIFLATGVAMVASLAQIAWVWFRQRKVDPMLWISLCIITVFGGLTLVLHDETFIKWKPTILYWAFAAGLSGGTLFYDKNFIRTMLQEQLKLPEVIWKRLNWAWIAFFTLMGFVNLAVAFAFQLPTETWVNFKLFGTTGLMFVFIVIQMMMLSKYIDVEEKD